MMEQRTNERQRVRGFFVDALLFLLFHNVSSSQVLVCSPPNVTEPLPCNSQQWVRILGETYAPQTDTNGSACQVNLTECNSYFYDTGMQVSCNGPARPDGMACREEVDVATARGVAKCLQDVSDVATLVEYDCIEETKVLNLCQASTTLTSDTPLYLASPNYPQSTPEGKMCTCTLQGSSLNMNAVEISIRSKLPWDGDSTDGDIYNSVFSVTSGRTDLWKSNECADCTTSNLLNTNLFLSDGDIKYENVTITYSDFGLTSQNVWVEVFEAGSSLNVSCSSSPLPLDRIITTTTSTTTATTHLATSYTTNPRNTTTSTNITVGTSVKTATSAPSLSALAPSRTTEWQLPDIHSEKEKSDSKDSIVLTVTLTLLMLVLIVIAAVIGVIIFRQRHRFKSDDYIRPWVLLQSWCHRRFHQKKEATSKDHDSRNHGNFDSVAMPDEIYETNRQDRTHDYPVGNKVKETQPSGEMYIVQIHPNLHSEEQNDSKENSTDSSTNKGEALIPRQLYESHQQMLDHELEKMRQERVARISDIQKSKLSTQKLSSNVNTEADNKLEDNTGATSQV